MNQDHEQKLKEAKEYWDDIHRAQFGHISDEGSKKIQEKMYAKFARCYGQWLLERTRMLELLHHEREAFKQLQEASNERE